MDIFDTRVMLRAVEIMKPARHFLLDTFFPNVETHNTAHVEVDVEKGGRKMAPFVRPNAPGTVVDRRGFSSRQIKVPYVKPKIPTKAADMLKRQPGENPYETKTPAQRAEMQLNKDLTELRGMCERREEWMAAQALVTGKVAIQGDGIDAEVDFLRSASHNITLAGGSTWAPADNPQIDTDITTWRTLISKDSGLTADKAVCGSDVAEAILHDANLQKLLDNRRTEAGLLRFNEAPVEGVTYLGNLRGVDLYSYDEWYEDDNGVDQPMIPADRFILGVSRPAARGTRHYGAIQDLQAGASGLIETRFFPKSWEEQDPSVRWLLMQSAPLPATHISDAYVSVDVL